jgi:tRNA pseudouridine synthase 10
MEEFESKLEEVKKLFRILSEGGICDSCLGRQFARISTGLTNKERGEKIRKLLSIPEAETCWICADLFENLHLWRDRAIKEMKEVEFESFHVGTILGGLLLANEEIVRSIMDSKFAEPLKQEVNRELGKMLAEKTGKKVDLSRPDLVVLIDLEREEVKLLINSLFIYGRYRKLKRGIPQTRWICRDCGGEGCKKCGYRGKMYEESVEELIEKSTIGEFGADRLILHGAGREDIDARMLGSGRPFVAEIKNPRKRKIDLEILERKINENDSVKVSGLRYVGKEWVEKIKSERFRKLYRVKLKMERKIPEDELREKVSGLKGKILQKTPMRVLHRRTDLGREREIYEVRVMKYHDGLLELEISAESGLYIKELIHGDFGRTSPNLKDVVGCNVDVVELDVIGVDDE